MKKILLGFIFSTLFSAAQSSECGPAKINYVPFDAELISPVTSADIANRAAWNIFHISPSTDKKISEIMREWRLGLFKSQEVRARIMINDGVYLVDKDGGVRKGFRFFKVRSDAIESAIVSSAINVSFFAKDPAGDRLISPHEFDISADRHVQIFPDDKDWDEYHSFFVKRTKKSLDKNSLRIKFVSGTKTFYVDKNGIVSNNTDVFHTDYRTVSEWLKKVISSPDKACEIIPGRQ